MHIHIINNIEEIFYNGENEMPDRPKMILSDSFMVMDSAPTLRYAKVIGWWISQNRYNNIYEKICSKMN